MHSKQGGFTLARLLVAIVSIAILIALILLALGSAIRWTNDAKIRGRLTAARAKAELYYNDNGNSYNGKAGNISGSCTIANSMFTDVNSGMADQLEASSYPGSILTCYSTATLYAISATLPGAGGTNSWCVDSTGVSKPRGSAINSTAC